MEKHIHKAIQKHKHNDGLCGVTDVLGAVYKKKTKKKKITGQTVDKRKAQQFSTFVPASIQSDLPRVRR